MENSIRFTRGWRIKIGTLAMAFAIVSAAVAVQPAQAQEYYNRYGHQQRHYRHGRRYRRYAPAPNYYYAPPPVVYAPPPPPSGFSFIFPFRFR